MAVQLSPGIVTREIDFTQSVGSVGTSTGAFVGQFHWGPCDDIRVVSSETALVKEFGKPTDTNFIDWFSASNFLAYSNNLNLVRVISENAKNATPDEPHVDITTYTGKKNLFAYSGDISQETWIRLGLLSVTKNLTVSGLPLVGEGNAYDLVEKAVISEHGLFSVVQSNDGETVTTTLYVKPLTGSSTVKVKQVLATDNNKSSVEATWDITAAGAVTVINTGVTSVITDHTATITKIGNWYKLVLTMDNLPEHEQITSKLVIAGTAGSNGNEYDRLGVETDGISFFAPQLEIGSTSTSYEITGALMSPRDLVNVPTENIGLGLLIKNDVAFENEFSSKTNESTMFVARHPGVLGNSLSVSIADEANFTTWKYRDQFDTKPGTSQFARNVGSVNDEVHVVVVDEDGSFSGVKGTVLERFSYLSKASDARGVDNSRIFYGDVINAKSEYVRYLGPVVNSRLRDSSFVKKIKMKTFGSGYSRITTTATIKGDGVGARVEQADLKIADGSIAAGVVETLAVTDTNGVKINWIRPVSSALPLAANYKIPLTFTVDTTAGTPPTGHAAYAELNASGKVTSVTITNAGTAGTGWTGTVKAYIPVNTNGYIKGYTANPLLLTTLHRYSGTPGVQDGFELCTATALTGVITAIPVSGAVSEFRIRTAINYKMPLKFVLEGTGTVGSGTEGYAVINDQGIVGQVVITDPGEGWEGSVQPTYWNSIGINPGAILPDTGFELNQELEDVGETLIFEGQSNPSYDRSGIGASTPAFGVIRSISITERGADYTTAEIEIVDNGTPGSVNVPTIPGGSGATADILLEAEIGGEGWGQAAVNTGTGVGRRFKSLKPGYNGSFSFSGGTDGSYVDAGKYILGWNLFKNKEETDISLIITGDCGQYSFTSGESHVIAKHVIDNIAEFRKDCVVFISPKLADVSGNHSLQQKAKAVVSYSEDIARSTSYAFYDSGWKVQYDPYNNKYRNIPLNADIAGLCAETDFTHDTWWSPAGQNRGKIKNCVSLVFNPDQTARDELYKNNINPVVTFRGEGTFLYGDRTKLGKSSAFSYINVRRLFIVLEKSIARSAKNQLFEFNDTYTRSSFAAVIKQTLEVIKTKRGITDYEVICDATNNPPAVVDAGEFVASIFIKPARSVNFVTLNFVAVNTGVTFSSVTGIGL